MTRARLWSLAPLVLCVGCASQGGLRFPFGGERRAAEPDSTALRVAAIERRVEGIDASLARLEALARQNHAATQAELSALRQETQAVSEKLTALERRSARELRGYALPTTSPEMVQPGGEGGLVVLDGAGRSFGLPSADTLAQTPGWTPSEPGRALTPRDEPGGPGGTRGAPGGEAGRTIVEEASGGAPEGERGDAPEEGARLYQLAYQDLMEENYQLALINFRAFLERYPQTRLSDNAQYWIGEVYYGQRQFQTAVEEFRRVIEDYPSGDKVPAAYYKIALCFQNLRDAPTARRYLEFLIGQYPGTREARLAEAALADL